MAPERSLFERLARAGEQEGRSRHLSPERAADSVLQHLRKMLNVHQGSVPTLPLYGMPDFNDMASRFPEAIQELKQVLKTTIEQYEPRLKRVRIDHLPDTADPLHLRFEITAQLMTGRGNTAIGFETALDTSGRVSIRG
jgi:type VI secretion system protein